jgi:hypothetical protein
MDAMQLRTELVALIQTLQAEVENDCLGIQATTPAPGAPGQTPDSQKAWADKLTEMQARASILKDLMAYIQACPMDPAEAAGNAEAVREELAQVEAGLAIEAEKNDKVMADLEEKLKLAEEALSTANAANAQTIAEFRKTGKVDATNRF